MRLDEFTKLDKFYHGSSMSAPVLEDGKVYRARKSNGGIDPVIEEVLEKGRPSNMIPRSEALYMVAKIAHVARAGGSASKIYQVNPIGIVQQHDIEWLDDIHNLMLANPGKGKYWTYNAHLPRVQHGEEDEIIEQAIQNYWNGVRHPHKKWSLWEFLTPSFRIVGRVR